jgi:platelet-activating factor acetylhydrolase
LDPWADPIPPAPSLTTEGADLARTNSNPAPTVNKAGEEGPPLDIVAPLLVINSESFTLWKEHYVLVRDIVNAVKHGADRWLMTMSELFRPFIGRPKEMQRANLTLPNSSVGSIHTSFSDMPLLAPFIARRTGARVESKLAMDQFVEACHEFLRGDSKGQILGEEVRDGDEAGARPGEGEREADRKKRRPMEGTPGSMRMHVRP